MTERSGRGTGLGRRGLLAGAAALVAGGLAKLAGPERAEAGHTSLLNPEPLHIGVINDGTNATNVETATSITTETVLVANGAGTAFRGRQLGATSTSFGVEGISAFTGVRGSSVGNTNGTSGVSGNSNVIGVRGFSISSFAQSVGVLGFLTNAANPFPSYNTQAGVLGVTLSGVSGAGVAGVATTSGSGTTVSNVGVHGQSTTGTGVHGDSSSGTGVFGRATSGSGTGVRGEAGDGNGVFGLSTNATGVYGFSGNSYGTAGVSRSFTGVYAHSDAHWGLHAESGASFAAVFSGPIFINGSYTATGAKSAAVKNRRGEHRRMYCQESTEAWFEDFGTAELRNGRAEVPLDPEFDEVVKGDDYRVFLTELGDCGGLYVSRKGPHRFEVRSRAGNAAVGSFDYRVVARRGDEVGRRLEKVDVPDFSRARGVPKQPEAPDQRPAPALPAAPEAGGRPAR